MERTKFTYDPDTDTFTIGGARFTGALLRTFGYLPVGSIFEIIKRHDAGAVDVEILRRGDAWSLPPQVRVQKVSVEPPFSAPVESASITSGHDLKTDAPVPERTDGSENTAG